MISGCGEDEGLRHLRVLGICWLWISTNGNCSQRAEEDDSQKPSVSYGHRRDYTCEGRNCGTKIN